MNFFAQRIAFEQQGIDLPGEADDHSDFQAETEILELGWKLATQGNERGVPLHHASQNLAQRRRRFCRAERIRTDALRGERIFWNIDTIEVAVVGAAILQMIVNLKCRAQRV